MALRTVNGQPDEGAHRVGDEIIAVEVPGDFAVDLRLGQLGMADEIPRASRQETECLDAIDGAGEQHVPRDLFLHESPIWLVGIQRTNHVIAVRPGVRSRLVFIVAVRFAEVNDIEPMPRPTLAIMRRR